MITLRKLLLVALLAVAIPSDVVLADLSSYSVGFSSDSDLAQRFVPLQQSPPRNAAGLSTWLWSNGSALVFDRTDAWPGYSWSTNTDPNIYGFRDTPTSEPLRFSEGTISVDTSVGYTSSIRGIRLYAGIFLYDPDKTAGQEGAWDNPYARGILMHAPKPYEPCNQYDFSLYVAGGLLGSQVEADDEVPKEEPLGSGWVTNTLQYHPSAGGGYDITWSNYRHDTGTTVHTLTDHTAYDLSNVAVGLYLNFWEFLSCHPASGTHAYVDNFQINEAQVIPAPSAFLLGAIGLGTVAWIRRRKGKAA